MMNVLECLQPKGEIPAHGCAEVEFVFSPLEAKCYQASHSTPSNPLGGSLTTCCLPSALLSSVRICTYIRMYIYTVAVG